MKVKTKLKAGFNPQPEPPKMGKLKLRIRCYGR